MITLRDIMTAEVVTVSADLSIRDAMALFTSQHVSGAPVVAGKEVIGVISASDLLGFAAALPGVPELRPDQPEWDEMEGKRDVESGEPELGDEPTARYFTDMWDDAGAAVDERFTAVEGPEWSALDEHDVSEVMTSGDLCAMEPNASVTAAAEYMGRAKVHRILVMDGKALVGIVTATDIAKAVAEHGLGSTTYVVDSGNRFDDRGWRVRR